MVTLKHIAAATGVSKAAVSSALSGRGRLGPETRQRIIAAAERLGYRPNLLVRGMQAGRTQSIGVILNTASSFRMLTAKGISDYLLDLDLSVVGFADLELARYVEPGLTTFNQFPEKNGSLAAELLVDRIEDKTSEQRRILLKPQLIERKSVAKPRS